MVFRALKRMAGRGGAARSDWLADAFRAEELAGHGLATAARTVALVAIAALLLFIVEAPQVVVYLLILALFAAIGLANYMTDRALDRPWLKYLFVALDFALLAVTFAVVVPMFQAPWPAQMALRGEAVVYYFLLVAVIAFSYSWRLMLWGGVMAAAAWSAGFLWLMSAPGTITKFDHAANLSAADHLADHLEPGWVDVDQWLQGVVMLLLVAGVLAAVVWRSRRLVAGQARAARARANLTRYFSPNLVEDLARHDRPLGATQRGDVAVLFADIVGFTAIGETLPPEGVMDLLRGFHGRMEEQVFTHGGTLEKFIGDAMLAVFGAPRKGESDASDALNCMRAMFASLEAWNIERAARGEAPIDMGVGVHFGPAVFGDIGSERNMAFAVIGDTTNAASRLQSLTRDLACRAVVSDAVVQAARAEPGDAAQSVLDDLSQAEPQILRGRKEPVAVWTLGRAVNR